MADTRLPKNWKRRIAEITGLCFCDRNCGCGENNRLWWWPVGIHESSLPSWLPGWTNGVTTEEIWVWLVENGRLPPPLGA